MWDQRKEEKTRKRKRRQAMVAKKWRKNEGMGAAVLKRSPLMKELVPFGKGKLREVPRKGRAF